MTPPSERLAFSPIGSAEEQLARKQLVQRHQKLQFGLMLLLVLCVLLGAAGVWLAWWGVPQLQRYMQAATGQENVLPVWYQPLLLGVLVFATLFHVWAIAMIRQTLDAMCAQVLTPTAQGAQRLLVKHAFLRPWLVFSQWLGLLLLALQICAALFAWWVTDGVPPNLWQQDVAGLPALFSSPVTLHLLHLLLVLLVYGIPALLNFWMWTAFIGWFDTLKERLTTQGQFAMRLAGKASSAWLLALAVLLGLQLCSVVGIGLFYLSLPQLLSGLLLAGLPEILQSWDVITDMLATQQQLLRQVFLWLGGLFLACAPLYGLAMAMVLWLRGFIFFSGVVLDADPEQQKQWQVSDWDLAEVVVVKQG